MKLYATITSERATKGQGGNKDLLAVFTVEIDGQRQEIASVGIVNSENNYIFSVLLPDHKRIEQKISKGKGACKHKNIKIYPDQHKGGNILINECKQCGHKIAG